MRVQRTNGVGRALTALLPAITHTAAAERIYVDANAKGANNGSIWADAYNHLQDALADANFSPKPLEIRRHRQYKVDCGVDLKDFPYIGLHWLADHNP